MLLNVKLKLIVRLMLKPVLNLGTMESTAIPINIKDSAVDTLMVKGTLCLLTPDILPLRTLDILPLLIPDIPPLFSRLKDILPLLTPAILLLLTPDILPLFSRLKDISFENDKNFTHLYLSLYQ